MLRRRSRVLAGLAAAVAIAGFAVGCGGDDSSDAPAATTVVVTETTPPSVAPIPDATTDAAATPSTDATPTPSVPGDMAEGRDMMVKLYTEQFGFTEAQASCLADKVIELGGQSDIGSLMAENGMQILNDCNISIADLTRIGEQMGGTTE